MAVYLLLLSAKQNSITAAQLASLI